MRTMRYARSSPKFDHGAALRVPPTHDSKSWSKLWMWLGDEGCQLEGGAVQVSTPEGAAVAQPGDWIVLSWSGSFYVARSPQALDA